MTKELKLSENDTQHWSIERLNGVCDDTRILKEILINFLNIKVGKTGRYPYSIERFYIAKNTGQLCIIYTDNNDMEADVGDGYYQVEKNDFDELINILNNPDMDIYFHLPPKI